MVAIAPMPPHSGAESPLELDEPEPSLVDDGEVDTDVGFGVACGSPITKVRSASSCRQSPGC